MLFFSATPQFLFLLPICLHLLITVVGAGADFYSLLSVPRNAGKDEIKKAYKQMSRSYHPDKNTGAGAEKAAEKFMAIKNAYDVLMDDEKRNIYDRFGEKGLKDHSEGGGQGHNPFDIFAQFFGGGGGGHHQKEQERRGPDISLEIEVDLKELYLGASIPVDVSKQTVCNHCHGTGAKNADDVKPCTSCRGQGFRIVEQYVGPGMIQRVQTECDVCNGHGKVIKSKCSTCDGRKVVRGTDQLTVVIEKGMQDGEQIGFSGDGDESPDYYAGDVVFTVKQKPHPVFVRRGDDLYTEETITLLEALTGFDRKINHLGDEKVNLSRTGVTQTGFVQVLENKGMPRPSHIETFGKLYVTYTVVFPTTLDEDKKKELKSILS